MNQWGEPSSFSAEGVNPPLADSKGSSLAASPASRHEQRVFDRLADSPFAHQLRTYSGDLSHLKTVSGRPPLRNYLEQLWQRRHFIWWESRSKVATANVDDRLGSFWLILRPLLDAVFYWLIFGLLLNMSRGLPNFVAFIIIGVFMFQYSSTAISTGSRIIFSSRSMIRAFQFPRASLPLAALVHDFLQRIPAVLVMFAIIILAPPHAPPNPAWLLFPVVLALQTVLNFSLLLFFGRLGAQVTDLSKTMPFFTRILMYGSGVIFPIDRFVSHPALMTIIEANPIYVVLDMYRTLLINGEIPSLQHWLVLAGWAFGLLIIGFLLFWSGEETYSREQ